MTTDSADAKAKLEQAYVLFDRRASNGEKLGFDPNELPGATYYGWACWVPLWLGLVAASGINTKVFPTFRPD